MELTIDQALQQAVEAHKAGKVQEADSLYTAILKAQPKHPDANHNMGVLAVGVGKVEIALPFFKTALEANHKVAQFWLSYIDALIKLDRLKDAKAVLDQAKSRGAKGDGFDKLERRLNETSEEPEVASKITAEAPPPQPNILDSLKLDQAIELAKKKSKDGSPEEAKRIYQNILVKFPKNKRAIDGLKALTGGWARSTSKQPPQVQIKHLINLYSQGQLQQALKQTEILVKQFPKSAILFNIQGSVLKGLGQLDASVDAYNKALSIKPDYAEAYNNMGNALQEQGKLDEAVEAYNKALSLKPDYVEAYNNKGVTLKDQGKLDEAIACYNKALSLKPDFARAYNNMGNALQEQGKLDEAIAHYNKALSLKPDHAAAHRHLSSLVKYKAEDNQVTLVGEMIQRSDLNEGDRCHLHYTFAKMNEDLGNFDTAYDNYVAGGKLRQKLLKYEFAQDEHLFYQIKRTAPKFKDVVLSAASEPITHTPIFILGMPRSGTTLVEQIISSHSQVYGAGELEFLSRFGGSLSCGNQTISSDNILQMRNAYLHELEKVSHDCPFVTDKMPQNFEHIGLLLKALPEATVIHVKRDPAATCWSNFKHYFSANGLGYSYDLSDTVNYFKLYQDLMDFWDQQYSDQIYHLDYDKLTVEQEPETRKLIEHLELDWEDNCLSPQENKRSVKTTSLQQVREKVYTGSSQAWRKFEPYLNGVFDEFEHLSAPPPK